MRTIISYILSLICAIALSHSIIPCDAECDNSLQPYSLQAETCDTAQEASCHDDGALIYSSLCGNDVSSHLRHSSNRQRNSSTSTRYKCAEVNHIKSINELHHNLHHISIESLSPELIKSECSFIALRKLII